MRKRIFLLAMFIAAVFGLVNAKVVTDYRNCLMLAYSPVNSVYEDDNIKLEIYDGILWATNKSKKAIVVDLDQSFLFHNGASYPMTEYYRPANEKTSSKGKISTSIGEYLTLAPSTNGKQKATALCIFPITEAKEYSATEKHSEDFSEYEERLLTIVNELVEESKNADPKGKKYIGLAHRHLTEDESVSNIGVSVAYAFNKKSDDWETINISTWVSDIIFSPYFLQITPDNSKNLRGFDARKSIPVIIHVMGEQPFEFNEEKSPIFTYDWEGNYKKGTFTLEPIKIYPNPTLTRGKIFGDFQGVMAG